MKPDKRVRIVGADVLRNAFGDGAATARACVDPDNASDFGERLFG